MPKSIYPDLSIIPKDKEYTFLPADVSAGAVLFGFQSSVGLTSLSTASGQILMFGELGNEKTEILKTSNVSTSVGSNIGGTSGTLIAGFRFDHPQDTRISLIDWDRFEVQHATTVAGTKTTLMAYPQYINPGRSEDLYRDTTKTSGFYFVRFNETVGNTNSDWSDAIPYAGYDDNTVFALKQRALESIGEKVDGEIISNEFLNRALWEARREYHQSQGKRPFRKRYNNAIGVALTGSYRIDLPIWVEKPHTAENVYGVRIGTQPNMSYYDKKEWDFDWRNKPHSTLDVPYTRGTSTSIWLANGRDFSGSPTISVEGMNITCTRITGSNNSFTITAHGSYPSASAGSDAYENIFYGLPDKFTVFAEPQGSAYICFNRPIDTAYVNQNIFLDAYTTIFAFDSDADALDEPNPDIYVPYLAWKIKKRKNPALQDTKDSDFQLWQLKKTQALQSEYLGVQIRITPDVDYLPY